MYADSMLSFGYLIAAIGLCAVVTGAAEPVLHRVGVERRSAFAWAVGMIWLAAVDGYAAAVFMLLPATVWAGRTESIGICTASFMGMLALGGILLSFMAAVGGLYAGMLGGLLVSLVARAFGHGEVSLCMAFGAPALAVLLSFVLEGLFGVVTPMAQSAYFDAAAAAAVSAVLLCAVKRKTVKPA